MVKPINPSRRFYLRERRNHAGMTQQALADAMGTTKGVISQLETGFTRYNEDWITKAAEVLRIEPADLLTPLEALPLAVKMDALLSEIVGAWPLINGSNRVTLASLAHSLSSEGSARKD